jgi:hypothetical protein
VGKVLVPPILKNVLFDKLSVPPAAERFAVKDPRSNVPTVTERLPVTLAFIFKVTVLAVLPMVRLVNVVAKVPPIDWAVVPLKVTVAVPAVNAVVETLFIQFPLTDKLKLFELNVPAVIVRLPDTVEATPNLTVMPDPFTVRFL